MSKPPRSRLEVASWIAGIIGASLALFAFLRQPDKPTPSQVQPTAVQQSGAGSTQIGNVTGNVTIAQPAPPPLPQTSLTGEFPVPKIYGLTYDDARKLLIAEGWIPAKNHHMYGTSVEASSGNGPIFWQRGYWEVEACSGTGSAHCLFRFFDPSKRVLVVVTEGEQAEDNSYSATVGRFFFEDKEKK